MRTKKAKDANREFVVAVGRALKRSARAARKTAKMYGTPVYVWKNGRVVSEKP